MSDNLLKKLNEWFFAQCDGSWEHEFGIKLVTLDNPGWSLQVGLPFETEDKVVISEDRTESNWIFCKVADSTFNGSAGPENLEEMLTLFLEFVKD